MCIPSQITCNCYSKVFNAFNVFKVSSLQGIWSMDLFDPFSCQLHHIAFDRLKSHTPLPCPGTQSINIPLKFHCVFFILNFTIAIFGDDCVCYREILGFCYRETGLSPPPPSILIVTVPRRYFCRGSLLLLVLAVRIYPLVRLLC